ncbi:GIY-YIG nuclease family protein [Pseudomonas sp. ES4]|uniref:GIY-YIG nuclease family protein n=1 Tax=Pseudomonas sp. ES4 TaxID=3424777 RepID=UPI003D34C398
MIGAEVELSEIIPETLLEKVDIHLATKVGEFTSLDVFRKDMAAWPTVFKKIATPQSISRDTIISLVEFPSQRNIWLFAGFIDIWGSAKKGIDARHRHELKGLIGRLKLKFKRGGASKPFLKGERHLENISVFEILREPFTGEPFPGYENINISFRQLRALTYDNPSDWVAALSSIKGIYLIADNATGKKYVGSAYGEHGLWSRWTSYAKAGHGNNIELLRLTKEMGPDYALDNFSISLLEYHQKRVDDKTIILREGFWKAALLTRTHGYNKN